MTRYFAPPDQNGLVLNDGDILEVFPGGIATDTTINRGGFEVVVGSSLNTTINSGGLEKVDFLGFQNNVSFGIPVGGLGGTLQLENPLSLRGTISDWRVGDVIELLDTPVTAVRELGNNKLEVVYIDRFHIDAAIYLLENQQPGTKVTYHVNNIVGEFRTDLFLTPIVGVPHDDPAGHHLGA